MNSERCRIMFVATELRPELIPTHSGRRSTVCHILLPLRQSTVPIFPISVMRMHACMCACVCSAYMRHAFVSGGAPSALRLRPASPPVLLVPYHAPARALPRRAAHTRKHPPTAYGRYTLFEQFVARKAVQFLRSCSRLGFE